MGSLARDARSRKKDVGLKFTTLQEVGDRAHIGEDYVENRVGALTVNQLAGLLAPTAWMSVDLHRRLGD